MTDANAPKPLVSWRKRLRNPLMNWGFWLFWIGMLLSYSGGMADPPHMGLIYLSFILFFLACMVPLVTKK